MAPTGAGFTAIAAGGYHSYALFQPDHWDDLGGGTVGVSGLVTASGSGPLTAGSLNSLTVTDAAPLQPMLAWISLNPTPFNALGGTVHAYPFNAQLLLFTNASGDFSATAPWPMGIPSGTKVWFQFIVQDFSVPHGLTLSNGLLATTP
jgi:hypothetical protein